MAGYQRASAAELIAAYEKTGSVHKAAAILGMCGASVHERLVRLGVKLNFPKWTATDNERLRRDYARYVCNGNLDSLAASFGRTKPFICRKARILGLTNIKREKPWNQTWKAMTTEEITGLFDKFKESRLGLGAFCKANGFDALGFSRVMKREFPDEWEHVIESKVPRQTMYRLGRQVEYAVRDALKKAGFFTLRSPRSGGPVDVIAIRRGLILLIQCKRSLGLGPSEWNDIFNLADSVGAIAILAGRPTGRGLVYYQLTGRKDGSKHKQPMCLYDVVRGQMI